MNHQKSQKILLEKFHFKNKLQYQSEKDLELYKENNKSINHPFSKETQMPQVKNI